MNPLVLVHGFMGGSAQWALQSALGDGRDLIGVDLPGFGCNAAMDPIDSITGFANWVLDHLSDLGVPEFDLLGHSMGGMIVQEMVRLAPARVDRLVLYGTGALGVLPGRFETIETSKARARSDGPQATARRIAATWFRDREHAKEYEGCARIAAQSSLPAILAGLDAMQGWSGADNLQNIRCKTLIVWGDQDRTYPRSQIDMLHETIPDSRLVVIPDAAHAVHLEAPADFNRVIEEFLEGNAG